MLHAVLKHTTRDLHAAVEAKLGVLLSRELTLQQYATVQKNFYGFYQPIERKLASIHGWDDPEFQLQHRLKLPLLMRDLACLSVDMAEIARLPVCGDIPRLETVAQALGCLYVLEGSTLGGKIITGHVKQVLPLDERRGCSFFNSYGDDVGPMWASFLRILKRHGEKHRDNNVIVQSACQTFSSLDRWLTHAA